MSKSLCHLPAGKLRSLPVPHQPWSHQELISSQTYWQQTASPVSWLLWTAFLEAWHLEPLKGFPTSLETTEKLFQHVFQNFGIVEDIISDRSPQFLSGIWRSFFSHLIVSVSLSSGYHPQTNGQTEQRIQDIRHCLWTYSHEHQHIWSCCLPWAEYAQN